MTPNRLSALVLVAMLAGAASSKAQSNPISANAKNIKKTPIAASGQEMFNSYCAVCHGNNAKGNGPALAALKVPPPDLTLLSQHHGGTYPAIYVERVLRFGAENFPAHGTKHMPIWGPLLGLTSGGTNAPQTAQRIYDLNQYIESLQAK